MVELYVNTPDADASLQRPIKRLEAFQKVALNTGETKTVSLAVKVPNLAFWNSTLNKWVVDTGRYGVQISKSSADADIQLQDYIQVSGSITPVLSTVSVQANEEGDAAQDIPTRVMFDEGKQVFPSVTMAMT